MMEIDGQITTHYQTTAEKCNNYYVSVADNITNNNPINNTIGDLNKINLLNYLYSVFKQSFTNIKIKNTTTHEIEKNIKESKSKKSCGYDEITTKILRCVIPVVCRLNQNIRCMHISSNTTIYMRWYAILLYVKHNYMFWPQMLAITNPPPTTQ
jgi:hypothetical protein